jgi:hypothetical protein
MDNVQEHIIRADVPSSQILDLIYDFLLSPMISAIEFWS